MKTQPQKRTSELPQKVTRKMRQSVGRERDYFESDQWPSASIVIHLKSLFKTHYLFLSHYVYFSDLCFSYYYRGIFALYAEISVDLYLCLLPEVFIIIFLINTFN